MKKMKKYKLTLAAQLTFFIIYSTRVSLFFFLLAYYKATFPISLFSTPGMDPTAPVTTDKNTVQSNIEAERYDEIIKRDLKLAS